MAKVGAGSPGEDGRRRRAALEKRKAQIISRINQEFQRGKANFLGSMIRERLSGAGPSSLARRTGQLARSLDAVVAVHEKAAVLVGFIGGGVPYAKTHEYGATITPKNGKYFAIPLGPAKTKGGDARVSGPRNWPNKLTFIKTKGGRAMLVEMFGTKEKKKLDYTHTMNEWGWVNAPGANKHGREFKVIKTNKIKQFKTVREQIVKSYKAYKVNTPGGTFDVMKKTTFKPIFLLVESVVIPARLNFRSTFKREAGITLDRVREAVASINSEPL